MCLSEWIPLLLSECYLWGSTGFCSWSSSILNSINDLPLSSSKLALYIFADDTNIYCGSESLNQSVVNRELKKVKMWLDVNKLSLNIDITNFIIFKSPQHSSPETICIKIGKFPIKQTHYVEFLGRKSFMEVSLNRTI